MQLFLRAADPALAEPQVTRLPASRRASALKVDRGDLPLKLGTRLLHASRCGSYGWRWHCAQAQPGHTHQAYRELVKQGFDAFVPLGCFDRKALTPVFGSYLFVGFDSADVQWLTIRSTKGVARLLMAGDRPQALQPGVVEELIERTTPSGIIDEPLPAGPQPGDRVLATIHGRRFEGICQLTTKQRVTLLHECFGGVRAMSFPRKAVTLVD